MSSEYGFHIGIKASDTNPRVKPGNIRMTVFLNSPNGVAILLIAALSVLLSVPYYVLSQGNPNSIWGLAYSWEFAMVFLIPLTGITASVFGWLEKAPVSAFLVGMVPHVPIAVVIHVPPLTGIGMGLIGAGVALVKGGKVIGLALFPAGFILWALFLSALASG